MSSTHLGDVVHRYDDLTCASLLSDPGRLRLHGDGIWTEGVCGETTEQPAGADQRVEDEDEDDDDDDERKEELLSSCVFVFKLLVQ